MLHLFAGTALLLTGADHWTTWLCLRDPVAGWHVTEANPVADLLFQSVGLVPGLAIDTIVTVFAVGFLMATAAIPTPIKTAFLALITATTGFAVVNNFLAIDAMGIWPL